MLPPGNRRPMDAPMFLGDFRGIAHGIFVVGKYGIVVGIVVVGIYIFRGTWHFL